MGISLGSSSKKPYVGSKEVQEAYVGTQKIYSAISYAFLGRENDYILADWATLSSSNIAITKYDNVFRIAISGRTNFSDSGQLTLNEVNGQTLKFIHKSNKENVSTRVRGRDASNKVTFNQTFNAPVSGWEVVTVQIPDGVVKIEMLKVDSTNRMIVYLDKVRIEG